MICLSVLLSFLRVSFRCSVLTEHCPDLFSGHQDALLVCMSKANPTAHSTFFFTLWVTERERFNLGSSPMYDAIFFCST